MNQSAIDPKSVKSGARILDLIEFISARDSGVSLADVVSALQIPKSSALMLINTLVIKRYVERDANGRYRLDELYRSVGDDWVGGRLAILRKLARPMMRELADAVQETVVIGILTHAFEMMVVEKVRSPREVRYDIQAGAPYPAYCTAIGRVILGFSDPALVEHYLRTTPMAKCTPHTIVDPEAIRQILSEVRTQGYAINIEEHIEGASSIAAPLLDESGQVVGALNVGCVSAHFTNNRDHITTRLLATAKRLNERFRRPAAKPVNSAAE